MQQHQRVSGEDAFSAHHLSRFERISRTRRHYYERSAELSSGVIRKATLISNPKTGRYGSRRLRPIENVASQLRSLGVEVDLPLTSAPGEATATAARAAN